MPANPTPPAPRPVSETPSEQRVDLLPLLPRLDALLELIGVRSGQNQAFEDAFARLLSDAYLMGRDVGAALSRPPGRGDVSEEDIERVASALALNSRFRGAVWPDNFDENDQGYFRTLARVALSSLDGQRREGNNG